MYIVCMCLVYLKVVSKVLCITLKFNKPFKYFWWKYYSETVTKSQNRKALKYKTLQ